MLVTHLRHIFAIKYQVLVISAIFHIGATLETYYDEFQEEYMSVTTGVATPTGFFFATFISNFQNIKF